MMNNGRCLSDEDITFSWTDAVDFIPQLDVPPQIFVKKSRRVKKQKTNPLFTLESDDKVRVEVETSDRVLEDFKLCLSKVTSSLDADICLISMSMACVFELVCC